jgi:hypothetical protein
MTWDRMTVFSVNWFEGKQDKGKHDFPPYAYLSYNTTEARQMDYQSPQFVHYRDSSFFEKATGKYKFRK